MRRWLLLLFVIVLTSCGVNINIGSPPPCNVESASFIASTHALLSEWTDADKVTQSAARITLGPLVSQMQAIKRRVEQLPTPACAQPVQTALLRAMNQRIDAYVSFLSQQPVLTTNGLIIQSQQSMDEATGYLMLLEQNKLPTAHDVVPGGDEAPH